MEGEINKAFPVSVSISIFDMGKISSYYMCDIWIEDDNNPDGGAFHSISKMHPSPMARVVFVATVDVDLQVGCVYFDGINNFIATSKNEIRNNAQHICEFKIPKQLACISKPYKK